MVQKDTPITIIGDGGWGTALALLLSGKGRRVILWGAFPKYLEEIAKKRENVKFLPGFKLSEKIELAVDIQEAVDRARIIVLAVPSQFMRSVLKKIERDKVREKIFVSVAKGVEISSFKTMSQVVRDELGGVKFCALSGPTIAREVAMKMPAAVSIASSDKKIRVEIRELFTTDYFSLFESDDVLGVELGGSVKNVIAIAAGIVEGLGFGSNTQAAVFARGIAEMARLGRVVGARRETFVGLSGLGDLATTCISRHSRNRSLGEEIGRGKKLREILKNTEMVVEGVETCRAVYKFARRRKVSMPIVESVHGILFGNRDPRDMVGALMKSEIYRESD